MTGRNERAGWTAVAVAGAALLVGSLLPVPLRRHPEFGTVGPDKALHFVGHAGFATALAAALADGGRDDAGAALLAAAVSTGYGAVLGRLQRWVPGRAFERADAAAGLLGSVAGVGYWRYRRDGRAATGDAAD